MRLWPPWGWCVFLNPQVEAVPFGSVKTDFARFQNGFAAKGVDGGVGGDSYDNALAETIIGLYKTELVRHRGPWRDSRTSSWPPWNGSTGSTTDASTTTTPAGNRQPKPKNSTTVNSTQPTRARLKPNSLHETR